MPETADLYKEAANKEGDQIILSPSDLHALRVQAGATLLAGHAPPKSTIIDMGCGYGSLLDRLDSAQYSAYLGIDPTESLIELARFHHTDQSKVKFVQDDLEGSYQKYRAEYVVCLGLACHLVPIYHSLKRFAGLLTSMAVRGVIVEFQDPLRYKGHFTSWSYQDVSNAFCRRVLPVNTVVNEQDSTYTCFIGLQ